MLLYEHFSDKGDTEPMYQGLAQPSSVDCLGLNEWMNYMFTNTNNDGSNRMKIKSSTQWN